MCDQVVTVTTCFKVRENHLLFSCSQCYTCCNVYEFGHARDGADDMKQMRNVILSIRKHRHSCEFLWLSIHTPLQIHSKYFTYKLTFVAGDHVTNLFEDVCEASSARDFCIFLCSSESPCANWPWRLQRRELRQEYIWKPGISINIKLLFFFKRNITLHFRSLTFLYLTLTLPSSSSYTHLTLCCHRHG